MPYVPRILQLHHPFLGFYQARDGAEGTHYRKVQGEHGESSMSVLRTDERAATAFVSLWEGLLLQAREAGRDGACIPRRRYSLDASECPEISELVVF